MVGNLSKDPLIVKLFVVKDNGRFLFAKIRTACRKSKYIEINNQQRSMNEKLLLRKLCWTLQYKVDYTHY